MIESGADKISTYEDSRSAFYYGRLDVIKTMVKYGYEINSMFNLAARYNHVDIANYLIDIGANIQGVPCVSLIIKKLVKIGGLNTLIKISDHIDDQDIKKNY